MSGGFDPVHEGHIALLSDAARLGLVTVVLNTDLWLMRKKGRPFMRHDARATVLRSIRYVNAVTWCNDYDDTVCDALWTIRPHIFANGGDRVTPNPKEHEVCKRLGIREIFNVGGRKIQSSSDLIRGALGHHKNTVSG